MLFLVDRANLGRQTLKEFQQYATPDDGRKFTELYNAQLLAGGGIDPVSKVCISTIQRLYSMLRGDEIDESLDEASLNELTSINERPREVAYNPQIPIETFDFVIVDECHRSIYNVWRQVLEYFDAYLIGLTATPSKQTFGFFDQNLVMEYDHERAVADGVNVGYDVYRIKTEIGEQGGKVDAGLYVDYRDKATREVRWGQLDEMLEYTAQDLDRSVVVKDQIRTVIRAYKDRLFTDLFPGREVVPKTLIFAKDDSHAEDIVEIVKDEFGKGNEFCKKITYKAEGKSETLISEFRTSPVLRVAVTVDMISTGTDIRPLEVLIFMRDVKSQTYYEQMVGRGTRIISETDLIAVTGDAERKTHFVLIDAVGVTESAKATNVRPLERMPTVSLGDLLQQVAFGTQDPDTLTTVASRLARLDRQIDERARQTIRDTSGGKDPSVLANALLDAVDPDTQREYAAQANSTDSPNDEQIAQAAADLAQRACAPFDDPEMRSTLTDLKKQSEQIIDRVSEDRVMYAGYDYDKAQQMVTNFKEFIEKNRDELTALQIIYNRPYAERHLTLDAIRQLADALDDPPYLLDSEALWKAYERLESARVRGVSPQRLLTDIVSLVRFALGKDEVLEPYPAFVERRFQEWLARHDGDFTPEQVDWLRMIKDQIATSLTIETEDFGYAPFSDRGGRLRAVRLFGPELPKLLDELNEELAA